MTTPYIFKQYTWLIETIRTAHKISFPDISRKWQETEMSGGLPMSRTSFNRHRDAILDMFGIIIECDRRTQGYYIFNERILNQYSVQNWMLSTLSVGNLLSENARLYDRIILESIPSADEYLQLMLKAMRENRQVAILYKRYGASSAKEFTACPYCLKLFNRRWYALMEVHFEESSKLLIFFLDRIGRLMLLDSKFEIPEDFDAAAFFDDCFGVMVGDDSEPVTIRLRAFGRERFAIQDLPIHHTQRIVAREKDYTDVEIHIKPTDDFKAFVTSKAQWLVVLSPADLSKEIQQWHRDAWERYAKI